MTAVELRVERVRAPAGPPPVVPGLPLLGSALALRQQGLLPLLRASQRSLGDVFRLRVGSKDNYVLAHPEAAAHVLQQNARNYTKSRSYARLKFMLGRGLLITEGDEWRRQRAVAQPFFHRQRVNALAGAICHLIDARFGKWEESLRRGERVDVRDQCKVLSLELVAHSVFGVDAGADGSMLSRSTEVLSDFVERQRWRLIPVPTSVPTPRNMMARYHRWCVDRVARRVAARGRAHGEENSLISMLLDARDEKGEIAFSESEVLDQIVTILVAGDETTAAALGWTMYLLARHRDVAERLREEVDRVVGRRLPTADELNGMRYLDMVLSESMRIYPPAWVLGRRSIAADAVCGYSIPADAPIGIYPFLIHRHPDFWSRPDEFDPENFAPAAAAARPRFAYFPFGGGARLCIGDRLAMLELKACIAMFVQRFRASVPPGYEPRLQPYITLGPSGGMPLWLTRRAAE